MRYSRLFNPLFSCSFIDPAENFDFNSFRSKHKVSLVSLKISPHALLLLAWSTTHRRFASETASLLTIFLENAPKSGSRSSFGFAHLVSINWSYVPFAAVKQSGSGPTVQSSIFVSFFFSTGAHPRKLFRRTRVLVVNHTVKSSIRTSLRCRYKLVLEARVKRVKERRCRII